MNIVTIGINIITAISLYLIFISNDEVGFSLGLNAMGSLFGAVCVLGLTIVSVTKGLALSRDEVDADGFTGFYALIAMLVLILVLELHSMRVPQPILMLAIYTGGACMVGAPVVLKRLLPQSG